jgi:hypothetical protein
VGGAGETKRDQRGVEFHVAILLKSLYQSGQRRSSTPLKTLAPFDPGRKPKSPTCV